MKKWLMIVAAVAAGLSVVGPAAQAAVVMPPIQEAAKKEPSKEEADLYKAWYDVRNNDIPKAVQLAKEYLEKYPQGNYAEYLKNKWLVTARGKLFNTAMTANNINEMTKIGREAIAVQDPNILDYVYLLAYTIRDKELFSASQSFAHAAEVADFSKRAIDFIEAGKTPSVVPADKWNQKVTLSWLYQNLAVIEVNNKNSDKALELFKKSGDLDPTNPYNFLVCGSLYQAKYAAAVQEYQALPQEQRDNPDANPAAKAKLEQVNGHADKVIDCWARFVALAKPIEQYKAQVEKVEKVLGDLYKYRHPDSPDGLEKLIQQLKNNPPNTSGR